MQSTRYTSKIDWLKNWAKENGNFLDVMNAKLVDDYEAQFRAKVFILIIGANRCPDLGRTLSQSFKDGLTTRGRVGLQARIVGMPAWVYVYQFKDIN